LHIPSHEITPPGRLSTSERSNLSFSSGEVKLQMQQL
jgi:hypothetical protein